MDSSDYQIYSELSILAFFTNIRLDEKRVRIIDTEFKVIFLSCILWSVNRVFFLINDLKIFTDWEWNRFWNELRIKKRFKI